MTVFVWKANPGDWKDPNSWAPHGVPTSNDFVLDTGGEIDGTNVTITQSMLLTSPSQQQLSSMKLHDSTFASSSEVVMTGSGNDVLATLDNVAANGILAAGYGPSEFFVETGYSFVNNGYTGASNDASFASLTMVISGGYSNVGDTVAGNNGSIDLILGNASANGQQVIWSSGLMEADKAGTLNISGQYGGALGNSGTINVKGGTVIMGVNLVDLGASAAVDVTQGGVLSLYGATTGPATIKVDSSTLEFGSKASLQFLQSPISLTGQTDTIQVDAANVTNLSVQDVSSQQVLSFVADYGGGNQVSAAINLDPSQQYAAGNFAITHTGNNSAIVFTHS